MVMLPLPACLQLAVTSRSPDSGLAGLPSMADIFKRRFGFDHAAGGVLNQKGVILGVRIAPCGGELIGREQAPVRQPDAPIGQ